MSEPLHRLEFIYEGKRYIVSVYPAVTHVDDGSELMRYTGYMVFVDGILNVDNLIELLNEFEER